MIGIDTDILVRYVVEDDPAQTAVAAAVIERAIRSNEKIFVGQIVLCELVWVLSYAYRFDKDEIVHVLRQLRRGGHVTIEGPDEARRAIEAYAEGRADFADYLIAERAIANACTAVATFDRVLYSDQRFVSPKNAR